MRLQGIQVSRGSYEITSITLEMELHANIQDRISQKKNTAQFEKYVKQCSPRGFLVGCLTLDFTDAKD